MGAALHRTLHNGSLRWPVLEVGWRTSRGCHLAALVLHHDDLWSVCVLLVVRVRDRRMGVGVGIGELLSPLHRRLRRRVAERRGKRQLLLHRLRRGGRVWAGLQ